MALNSSGLKSELKSQIEGIDNSGDFFGAFAAALNSYVTSNLEITGTYAGAMPSGSPSGFNGPHVWEATIQTSAPILKSSVDGVSDHGDFKSSFESSVKSEMKRQFLILTSKDGAVTVSSSINVGCGSLNFNFNKEGEFDATMAVFANAIVNAIISGIPSPASAPAIGTDGSAGNVSFSVQS